MRPISDFVTRFTFIVLDEIVFKASIDQARCRRRESDGRTEIAFSDPQRVDEPFEWANHNPVRYNALTRAPLTNPSKRNSGLSKRAFRLSDQSIRDAIKAASLAKLRKPADMVTLVKAVAQKKPQSEQELAMAAKEVCDRYRSGTL